MDSRDETRADEGKPGGGPASPGLYDSFDRFLQTAIKEYYDRGWKTRRLNFIALLMASGETVSMAMNSLKDVSTLKKLALGVGGAIALRAGLRFALGGPLAAVATGLAVASLVAFYVKNQKAIGERVKLYKGHIAEARRSYDDIQLACRRGDSTVEQRNLMIDGLLKRFLAQLDEG
jgi:hypothetical protein